MDAVKRAILRVIIYARVSTDEQAERGYSLDTQVEACRRYAERLDMTIVAEFKEDFSGVTPIAERPEGKKVVDMLTRHAADAIVVYQVDRLSRDIVNLLTSVQMWTRAGVQVHTCDVGRIENELDIVLVIKGWQGSDERKKIIERTSRGRNGKARSGKVVGAGFAPYGYCYALDSQQGGKRGIPIGLAIYEEEARIVRLIYEWYVRGEAGATPLSEKRIALKLSMMQVSTPGESRRVTRKRAGCMWNDVTVHRILTSETYAGVWYYGKNEAHPNLRKGKDHWIAVSVPAIIDRDLWNAAQEQRVRNKRDSKRNAKREYLLRGMVKCRCGWTMTGIRYPGKRDGYGYFCYQRFSHHRGLEQERCTERLVSGAKLENLVWAYITYLVTHSKLEKALRKAQEEERLSIEPKRKELEALVGLIHKSEEEAAKLAKAWKDAPEGIVKDTLKHQIDQLDQLYVEQSNRRAELEVEVNTQQLTDENIETTVLFCEDVVLGIKNPTLEDKRRVLHVLNTQVKIDNQRASIKCILRTKPHVIDLHHSRAPLSK